MEDDASEQSTVLQLHVEFSPKPEAVFSVSVVDGPDKGKSMRVDGTREVLVGQSPACDLQLSDAAVSRRHVALEVVGHRLRVRDVGSSNGTYVGKTQVVEALIGDHETLSLGDSRLSVERDGSVKPGTITTDIRFGPLLGASREMRRLYPLLARLATSMVPVLIEGETGTGKEVAAQALHEQGPRATGPYIVFDCTAVTPNLIESELFGHERGAFTGATAQRRGVFEQASGGTLFIDEIGDLPSDLQPKLLRVLERSELRRVGGDRVLRCDTRVIAATRRDVDRLVQQGRFRDDLFHRLAVGRVELPPLRRRRGDVPLLIEHFCKELGGDPRALPASLLSEWLQRVWPGNVRELRNAVARHLAVGDLSQMKPEPDPPSGRPTSPGGSEFEPVLQQRLPFPDARQAVLDAFQRRYLQYMLDANQGNVQKAAQASGVALRYFQLLRARVR